MTLSFENNLHRITHPLTGRLFRATPKASVHSVFTPQRYGIGTERTDAVVRERIMRKSYRPRSRQASTNPHMLRRLFRTYDVDHSGGLDVDEFLCLLGDIGVQGVSEEDCRVVFQQYDTNGDGTVSYKEWCDLHCRHFTSDVKHAMLDLPSLRLDVRHAQMTETEAMDDLRATFRSVLQKTPLGTLLPCVAEDDVKHRLLDAGIGLGNELALRTLLQQARCRHTNTNTTNTNPSNIISLDGLEAFVARTPTRPRTVPASSASSGRHRRTRSSYYEENTGQQHSHAGGVPTRRLHKI
jgi:hypothetical protein